MLARAVRGGAVATGRTVCARHASSMTC